MNSLRLSVDLSRYQNREYDPGRSFPVRLAWFFIGSPLLRCTIIPFSAFRRALLRLFGAEIGLGTVMQQPFSVKYPWNLRVGANSWFGEHCWIDNLAPVTIGSNVCISQAAYFCTGNHDWSDPQFSLRFQPIAVGDGAWIGARTSVGPGVIIGEGAVVALGSVVSKNVAAYEIHAGNPARFVRKRELKARNVSADLCAELIALSS